MRSTLLWENTQLLVKNHASPSRLPCGLVPVDIDVTPCDNSKTKKERWLREVNDKCLDVTSPREGKAVYIGSTWRDISYAGSDGEKHPFTVRTVYEITERSIDKHGQYLFPADVEVNMWDVNVEFSDRNIIALYHAHGESEQFHSKSHGFSYI